MDLFRKMVADCGTTENKLRKLREYARENIPGVWHYPDDREPCPYCDVNGLSLRHLPQAGIRGYLGAGPFAIVSDTPSGDVHFQSKQADLYYAKLKTHGLESAFQTDAFNTAKATRDGDEQKALFLVQIEVVQPKAMLVMDKSSRPRKRRAGWHSSGPIQPLEQHLRADGFAFGIDSEFELRAATVTCEPPTGTRFSFDVYRIYHYTKLTDYRWSKNPEADWEEQFTNALRMAHLTTKVGELKAELEKLPANRQEQLRRELGSGAMSNRYADLLEFVKAKGRVCPQPMAWNRLWEMLPDRRRVGGGWEPALPLILAAWWDTPGLAKHLRFLEHLEWANEYGCLEVVDAYIRALPESEWFHFGD